MINTNVRAEIQTVVREILREPELDIQPDQELRDELGLDSADLAELVVTLEARLGIPLPDNALTPANGHDPLSTVDTLARTVAAEASRADR